jgi:NADPH:quinone reductase-like Zn-dependent oxidoreductase
VKAIRVHQFGGPEVLRLEEVATPRPGTRQVLVRVQAIGVNPVETYQRSGSNPQLVLPWTPGLDAAGVIETIGAEVTSGRPGDRVYTSDTITGSYAEFTLCDEPRVHPLPAGLTFAAFDLLSVICNAFAVSEQDYCSDRAVGDMKRKDLPTLNLYTVACAACADPVSRRSPTILISQETNR